MSRPEADLHAAALELRGAIEAMRKARERVTETHPPALHSIDVAIGRARDALRDVTGRAGELAAIRTREELERGRDELEDPAVRPIRRAR